MLKELARCVHIATFAHHAGYWDSGAFRLAGEGAQIAVLILQAGSRPAACC